MGTAILEFLKTTGFYQIFDNPLQLVMILIACVLLYLAIVKKFEPLLLLPIAFGMLLTNLPGAELYHTKIYEGGHVNWAILADPKNCGLLDYLYLGVKLGIYPCLIFMGVGAMTDFGPLIANPKSLILGAAAQLGIYMAYGIALIYAVNTASTLRRNNASVYFAWVLAGLWYLSVCPRSAVGTHIVRPRDSAPEGGPHD